MHNWPNWHKKYPFNDFYINKFSPNAPGVFYIYKIENNEIVYFGYSENIRDELLRVYEGKVDCINEIINSGERLGFSYFKAEHPKRFYYQVLESFNKLYKVFPRCQGS